MNRTNLTSEEISWGRLYAWIHQRAEALRQKKVATSQEKVIPTSEIIKFLEGRGLKGNQKANQMELGGYLKELGVEKVTTQRPVGYKGIRSRDPKELKELGEDYTPQHT